MLILGLSCFYHDSAACILKDGIVLAAAEEERFTRKKHTRDFPENAVKFCLSEAGASLSDLNMVVFYELPRLKFHRIISSHIRHFPRTFEQFRVFTALWLQRTDAFQRFKRTLSPKTRTYAVEHHLTHGASAFLPSPFEKAAILTVDGVGEWATASSGVGSENSITLNNEIRFPHSLGLLYSAVTSYLGFKVNSGEGKVMGLASYGKAGNMTEKFNKLLNVRSDGSFQLNMEYFEFHRGLEMYGEAFHRLFNCRREPESEILPVHQDMAAGLQKTLEDVMLLMAKDLHGKSGLENLVIGGGVGLNSVANGRILRESGFENIFIQPACSDAGSALGAALYGWNCILGRKERWLMDPYLGHRASSVEIRQALDKRNLTYFEYKEDALIEKTAELISRDKMVGWYQGPMEFGPRALGNRSILANPANPQMKDILNSRVKFREPFRPYAASVMEEHMGDYFSSNTPSPHMLLVYDVLEEKRDKIPSVTHVDGTCRVQSVTPQSNPLYYRLIDAFYRKTGIPMILNTSFNVRGEPIVMNAGDAVNCYLKTDLDALGAGSCLLMKDDFLSNNEVTGC